MLIWTVLISGLAVLGGGQIYLWIDNRALHTRITRVEAEQVSTGRTLVRIDTTLQEISTCVHSISDRLARMEGPQQ